MLGRIAVHMDSDADCATRIGVGVQMAQRHHAELVGIHASFEHPHRVIDTRGLPIDAVVARDAGFLSEQSKTRFMLERAAACHKIPVHWRAEPGMPESLLARYGHYCDLILMSQPVQQEGVPQQTIRLFAAVVLAAGRPVLAVPTAWSAQEVGERVVLCWDQSAAAARALSDATHLLQVASELTILVINSTSCSRAMTSVNCADLRAYCARRGLPSPRVVEHRSGLSVAEVILGTADEHGADLIAMGAYGYSRLQAAILGGTTRRITDEMDIPVLFSH